MNLSDYFHILNPSVTHRPAVQKYFSTNQSLRCAWVERTSHPTHLETILNWALVEGHHQLALWGGDGTFNRSIQFLFDNKALGHVTLSLMPAGTCNDFYRKIATPQPLWKNNYTQSRENYLDLGVLAYGGGKRIFLNNAGFGRTKAATKEERSPLRDVLSLTGKNVNLEWDDSGQTHSDTRFIVLGVVCNSPFFNCGLHFTTDCDPSDGRLDGFFETAHSKLGLITKLLKGRIFGHALSSEHTLSVRSSKIRVSSDHDLFPQVDGEPVTEQGVNSLVFSVLPKAVRLRVWDKTI